MRRRDGFKYFINKVEGKPHPVIVYHPFGRTRIYTHSYRNYQFDLTDFDWIKNAFEWDSSPQGHRFWYNIYHNEGDIKMAKEILTSWREQGYL